MFAILGRMRYLDRLAEIERKADPQPAAKQGKDTCCRSGVCCWRRPCDLAKGDPEAIAGFLGVTPEQLFRESLVVDSNNGAEEFILRPRRVEQEGGVYLTTMQTYDINTPCVFLDVENQNACRIHSVKPKGGKEFDCGKPGSGEVVEGTSWSREELEKLGWSGRIDD